MSVRFVAIVGYENKPLYFKSASGTPAEVQINHQFIAEMSLDFIEQQALVLQQNLRTPLMVVLHDGIAVYAMLSNTRTKYIVGLESTQDTSDIGRIIHAVADAYVGYQCNPFGPKGGAIKSPLFDKKIVEIIS